MGSIVAFVDETHGVPRTVTLIYPSDADISEGRIAILTSVGAALIGLRAGLTPPQPFPSWSRGGSRCRLDHRLGGGGSGKSMLAIIVRSRMSPAALCSVSVSERIAICSL